MSASAPTSPPATPPLRLVGWCVLLLVWTVLTYGHFKGNSARVEKQGNPLADTDLIVANKVALLHVLPGLSDSGVLRSVDADALLVAAPDAHPDNLKVRYRCALLLTAADNESAARRLVEASPKHTSAAPSPPAGQPPVASSSSASSSQKAPALSGVQSPEDETSPTPVAADVEAAFARLWSATEAHAYNRAALEAAHATLRPLAEGWLATWLDMRFLTLEGQEQQAAALHDRLVAQANRVLLGLVGVGLGLVFEFVAGVVTLLVWITRSSEMAHRTTPEEEVPNWDPLQGFGVVVLWMVLSVVGGEVAHRLLPGLGSILLAQLIIYGGTLAAVHAVCQGRWQLLGVHARALGRSLWLGIWALTVNFLAVAAGTLLVARLLGHHAPSSNVVFQLVHDSQSTWQIVALGLLVALIGPAFEEIVFRGLLFGAFRTQMGRWAAALLSGLLFSVAHADPNSAVPLWIMGTLLAVAYDRTRSLWTSTTMHCIWNGQVFLTSLLLFS